MGNLNFDMWSLLIRFTQAYSSRNLTYVVTVVTARQVILSVYEATSVTSSTGIADLEAVQEVDETKSINNEIKPNIRYYVSFMQLLEVLYKRNTIAMFYGDIASCFC